MKRVVRVMIPRPVYQGYDYALDAAVEVTVGSRVEVPFGSGDTLLVGFVAALDPPNAYPLEKLKDVSRVLDSESLLSSDLLALIRFVCAYYHHPPGEVWQAIFSPYLRKAKPLPAFGEALYHLDPHLDLTDLRGKKRRAVCQALRLEGALSESALKARFQLSSAWLRNFAQQSYVQVEPHAVFSALPAQAQKSAPPLSVEQEAALAAWHEQSDYQCMVLQGVTGSGKTEVYMRLCAETLAKGQQVLLLAPEIALAETLARRFLARFEVPLVCLHSELSERQRLEYWRAAGRGAASIVIGTRSAVFTPFACLGLIVVDEEHDLSYKQHDGLRYQARDLAVMRAHLRNIGVILGSATPSLEAYHQVRSGKWRLARLTERVALASVPKLPKVQLIDTNIYPAFHGLSQPLLQALHQTLHQGEQALLFLNQRGFAPMLRCQQCGWDALCRACDAHLHAHLQQRRLICHHCGLSSAIPTRCPHCGSGELRLLGLGTERLEQRVQEQLPQARLLRVDSDSVNNHAAFACNMQRIERGEVDIILGTQWLSKGHHFSRLTLSAVIDVDNALFHADFRAQERLAQLLMQVAGRAGREHPGRVMLQTAYPQHPVFQVLQQDYSVFLQNIYEERRSACLPPFGAMALILGRSRHEALLAHAMQHLAEELRNFLSQQAWKIDCLGPAPAWLARKADVYRMQILLHSPQRALLQRALPEVVERMQAGMQRFGHSLRYSLDVDPQEIV